MESNNNNGDNGSEGATERWTCEACGCNTNPSTTQTCSICGTSSGSSILRRAGFGARAGLFARGLGGRRDVGDHSDLADLWGRVVDGVGGLAADDGEAMAALAMEVAGNHSGRNRESSRQRLLDAARSFSLSGRETAPINPQDLMQAASDNASNFRPRWANSSQIGGRANITGNGIQIEADMQNVAHLPIGAGEGRAVRAAEHVPRTVPFSALVSPGRNPERRHRRCFGFRVAFDHPDHEPGSSLGGCYLVGVTSSFNNFGERNALQQSPLFWGVEDSSKKYEGSRYRKNAARGGRGEASTYGSPLTPGEAPLNSAGVLFGCREVVTVLVDVETRAMTFWRDGQLLGTLVSNLPRGSSLYPVAVPFNAGATVAITGMDGDPLQKLQHFASGSRQAKHEKNTEIKLKLLADRSKLIQNSKPSEALVAVLTTIFSLYANETQSVGTECQLSRVEAARLWYRCGMKLATLHSLFEADSLKTIVKLDDFLDIINKVILEEEEIDVAATGDVRKGDKVQLGAGYESKGDAASGPLQPGDRGTVVELQKGPNGQSHSVRVLHGGRRWWYQPQAVVSERSGLIESAAVWFLKRVLRAHAFDPATLTSLDGNPVTKSSWKYGDWVVLKSKPPASGASRLGGGRGVGRIIHGTGRQKHSIPTSTAARGDRQSVLVEFVDNSFHVVSRDSMLDEPDAVLSPLKSARFRISDLVHCSPSYSHLTLDTKQAALEDDEMDVQENPLEERVSASMKKEIELLQKLNVAAIESITKDCKRSNGSLATWFAAGLPDAVVVALKGVDNRAVATKSKYLPSQVMDALTGLILCIAKSTFLEKSFEGDNDNPDNVDGPLGESMAEEAMDESGGESSSRRTSSSAFERAEDYSEEHSLTEAARSGRLSTLQERRSVLLALMSRARRTAGSLNELVVGENDGLVGLRQAVPGRGPFRHSSAAELFHDGTWDDFFGLSSDASASISAARDSITAALSREREEPQPPSISANDEDEERNAYLWSILQGSTGMLKPSPGRDATRLFVGSLTQAILGNSLAWMKAVVEMHCRSRKSNQSSALRGTADEDGLPVLQLAIELGCSTSILSFLIQSGAQVNKKDVVMAAKLDQSDSLRVLLQHTTYTHGLLDLDKCSPNIAEVVKQACTLQDTLKKRMSEETAPFFVTVLRRLLHLGLVCRHLPNSPSLTGCGETVMNALSGYAMSRALQQPRGRSASDSTRQNASHQLPASTGLLKILPTEVMVETLLEDSCHMTNLLLLIEDHLYSKSSSDAAVGLTMLLTMLEKLPFMSTSFEIQRYGFEELVASQESIASGRLAEHTNLEMPNDQEDNNLLDASTQQAEGCILCPAKHVAVLHITRHSSFRCDLCGKGVERGRPMHGCRECDWDACFECTDKKVGYIKHSHVKHLSKSCRAIFCKQTGSDLSGLQNTSVDKGLEKLSCLDNSADVRDLSICLQQRENSAIRKLSNLLEEPGQVTMHQFSKLILPSLHASLLGNASECERHTHRGGSGHRNKKAKIVGESGKVEADVVKCLLRTSCKALIRQASVAGGEEQNLRSAGVGRNPASNQKSEGVSPDIVRRIHKVLSFYETVSTTTASTAGKNAGSVARGALKSLTQPMVIQLWPSSFENQANNVSPSSIPLTVKAEPLISIDDIELHVLRTCKFTSPAYTSFCERLALDKAVIVEQARSGHGKKWKVGRIASYNASTASHSIQYALAWKGQGSENEACLEVNGHENESLRNLQFAEEETCLILAAREYYILARNLFQSDTSDGRTFDSDTLSGRGGPNVLEIEPSSSAMPAVGSRVEMNCVVSQDRKHTHTVLTVDTQNGQCVLVSDSGEVSTLPSAQVAAASASLESAAERSASRTRQERDPFARGFPFLSARNHLSELSRRESERSSSSSKQIGVIKRTWSALSLTESMRPIELSSRDSVDSVQDKFIPGRGLLLSCDHGVLLVDQGSIEVPPLIRVEFSTRESLATFDMQSRRSLPLVGALKQLRRLAEDTTDQSCPIKVANSLYYAVKADDRPGSIEDKLRPTCHSQQYQRDLTYPRGQNCKHETWALPNNRTRKVPGSHFAGEDEQAYGGLCDGLDESCVQCMEVLGTLSEFAAESITSGEKNGKSAFENVALSKKLADELDDPLTVVGGALPDWCVIAPTFAPALFSYSSRRLLLERSAFGVSRSTLKQQEAKVNVGRLRQRMASLRGRAVELVGEAFSGGAEDPTALQLQADELYGMEESLANRVKAAFRAEQWEEHALEVAKAAVGRDQLISDAEKIMEKIAKVDSICGRRLEVRFENESGFDAAAGVEAGVTRGFYADVAEALLSCDNVSGVHCNSVCPSNSSVSAMDTDDEPSLTSPLLPTACELPLFIPDTDANSTVIIPTPRSDPSRGVQLVGIYPRPLSFRHPQFGEVLMRYKFMGRLFACAMRDGFMFPLPLSASFLKLVQRCGIHQPSDFLQKSSPSSIPSLGRGWDDKVIGASSAHAPVLNSSDLPRPGFLGGEIYAAETHICRALDRVDASDPPLDHKEVNKRYDEIATDKSFARLALGKSYDCSFEDYFQDRTFVDPLDPTQGPEATPLCADGHLKQVTIHNIRDWVVLSKKFFLNDGVIAQACAFRSGVGDFFSAEYLRLFTPEELQRDVCGIGDNVDHWVESDIRELLKLDGGKGAAEALAAVAAVGGGGGATLSRRFSSSSPTINFLVKALLEAQPKQRRQFLSFVTSVPIVTPGKIEVVPVVSAQGEFQSMQDPGCLPRANTCARKLYLPKFEDYESFSQVLWAVVKEESRFKGFYEWRGS